MSVFVDRVERGSALVGNQEWPGDDYVVTVWRSSGGDWWLTHGGQDVAVRRTYEGAVNAALRLLGVDPKDERIEWTDERTGFGGAA